MIDLIFTLDYEIYGNGAGGLQELVHAPAVGLMEVFRRWNARFVSFVEAAEFEIIEAFGTDPAVHLVKEQIRDFRTQGFEVALHLHPQWYNARYENHRWLLDYNEYNLCMLSRERITQIVDRAVAYLRNVLGEPGFTPLAFRAGNWLFQPTSTAASVLAERNIRVDSSVFKGGLQRNHRLDYRAALRNGYYWTFLDDANIPNEAGSWLEIPVYAEMVPFWRMITAKRVGLQARGPSTNRSLRKKTDRVLDYLRFRYPLKLDFCRMTLTEMTTMMSKLIAADHRAPEERRPVVAIGHTKDLPDLATVDAFLSFLRANGIRISTFADVYPQLASGAAPRRSAVAH